MLYHGNGMYQWDTWCIPDPKTNTIHAFYLQTPRPGSTRSETEANSLGHAVSTNLLDWEEMPPILPPHSKGEIGDMRSWTGSCIEHDGMYYMFYTIRSSKNGYRVQCIGMAKSPDLYHWEECEQNPIITPDQRWYNTEENPSVHGLVCCRDLMVVKHDQRPGWFGVFATRIPSPEIQQGSVFAGAYTEDFIHWEQTAPVFQAPDGKYSIVEMPDLYYFEGKWILSFLEDNLYGHRHVLGNKYDTCGTVYAVADRLEGPYVEPKEHLLLASMGYNGFSCRTFDFKGKKYVLYSMGEREKENDQKPTFGTLSTPKEVRSKNGQPRYYYAHSIMQEKVNDVWNFHNGIPERIKHNIYYENEGQWRLKEGILSGKVNYSWCRYCFEPYTKNFTMTADVVLEDCAVAGFSLRQETDLRNDMTGMCIYLDAESQVAAAASLPRFQIADMRPWKVERNCTYHLRIVNLNQFVEFYVDDELVLQFVSYVGKLGGCNGLFVERGQASFSNVHLETFVEC